MGLKTPHHHNEVSSSLSCYTHDYHLRARDCRPVHSGRCHERELLPCRRQLRVSVDHFFVLRCQIRRNQIPLLTTLERVMR